MPTILKRMFQPKWQSSKTETRLEAIDSLTWENEEQRQILLKLAEADPEISVREKAVLKIADSKFLLNILQSNNQALQTVASQRLAQLIEASPDQAAYLQNLALDSDDHHRYLLLQRLNQTYLKLGLLQGIRTPRILAEIAVQEGASKIRQAAAEQLDDYTLLEDVMKASMNKDKGVYQIAKTKLANRREAERLQHQLQQQIEDVCSALEAHAASEATHLYEAKFDVLNKQWQVLASQADSDTAGRAERAVQACVERIRRHKEEDARRVEEAQQTLSLQQERVATCETLEQAIESLHQVENPGRTHIPGLDALIKTQETRWLEATHDRHVEKSEQKRFQQAMHQLRVYLNALQKITSVEPRLLELLQAKSEATSAPGAHHHNTARDVRQLIEDVQWPEDFKAPQILVQAREFVGHASNLRKQQAEDVRHTRQAVDQVIKQLETELDERSLKNSVRLFKDLQRMAHKLPSALEHEYQGRLKLLHGRVQELRDWQGFATRPKQEELCERMEHLAEQHLDPQVKAHRIKELQNEWRALGGSSDQALWSRFKAASDKAYEPCQAFFAEHDLLKQTNLDKREMLCEQLQNFLDHINWDQVDWKAMDKISRKAREEWHRFYPVDHKRNKPVQKHFHKLIEELESHLNEERTRNAALKTHIVQRAEALLDQDDMREAAQTAKALQKEWQSVGLTEHREDRLLWKSFRAACDQIFAKLDSQRTHHQHEVLERVQQAERIVAELANLAQSDETELASELARLQQEYKSLGTLPRDQHQRLQEHYNKAVHAIRETLQRERLEQSMQQWRELAQRVEELARFEDAVISGQNAEETPSLQLPASVPPAMRDQILSRVQRAQQISTADYENNQRLARLLAIQAEILAGQNTPEAERALRMEYQMARLSEGLGNSHGNRPVVEQMLDLLSQWYGLGPVSPTLRAQLQERLDHALVSILRSDTH